VADGFFVCRPPDIGANGFFCLDFGQAGKPFFYRLEDDKRPAIPGGADERRGTMLVQLNGKRVELDDEVNTVRALLMSYQLQEKIVVVERNGEIVDRARYETTPVADGDRIEIVHFVGGG
jgi:sulfur carrier protein